MGELIGVEVDGGVALVTLQRPEKRNALSIDMRFELAEAFQRLAADDGVACGVVTGAGPAFCAGMDVTQFGGDRAHKERLVESSIAAFGTVYRWPKPLIAAVNGPAIAGGFVLALHADMRLASHDAVFGFSELPRGIPPSYAAARAVLPAPLARELALTGRILDAREAQAAGLVSDLVGNAELVDRALELGRGIAELPFRTSREIKRRILAELELTTSPLLEDEQRMFRESLLGGDPAA
jgi:enoyl-CoA hydratase/carnithine racemase